MIKKQGTPTGTVRRKRFDALASEWIECWHICPSCELKSKDILTRKKDKPFLDLLQWYGSKVWMHKTPYHCNRPIYDLCDGCISYPNWLKEFHYK